MTKNKAKSEEKDIRLNIFISPKVAMAIKIQAAKEKMPVNKYIEKIMDLNIPTKTKNFAASGMDEKKVNG